MLATWYAILLCWAAEFITFMTPAWTGQYNTMSYCFHKMALPVSDSTRTKVGDLWSRSFVYATCKFVTG